MFERSWIEPSAQAGNACFAAAIAALACAASACANSPMTSFTFEGLRLTETPTPGTHSPAMRFWNVLLLMARLLELTET